MKPNGWGLCCECANQTPSGVCVHRNACYYGMGRAGSPGMWKERKAPKVDASPTMAFRNGSTIRFRADMTTKYKAIGGALAHGQRSIDEARKRLEECGTPATCGDCALYDRCDTHAKVTDSLGYSCLVRVTPKPAPSTPVRETCGECWGFHTPGAITSYCEWMGEGHDVEYDDEGRYCKGRAFAPREDRG